MYVGGRGDGKGSNSNGNGVMLVEVIVDRSDAFTF